MEEFDPTQPSQGLGDTIAKITHYTGISKLTDVITDALGIEDCGCNRRRVEINESYSYNIEPISGSIENDASNISGIYTIIQPIIIEKEGVIFDFQPNNIVLINENHSLYNEWSNYITIGAVKKLK